jgi:hypothetical protein
MNSGHAIGISPLAEPGFTKKNGSRSPPPFFTPAGNDTCRGESGQNRLKYPESLLKNPRFASTPLTNAPKMWYNKVMMRRVGLCRTEQTIG